MSASNLLHDPAIAGTVVNGHDVTERRAAEQLARQAARRFRRLVQHATELIIVWDEQGSITYASPATVRFASDHESGDPDTSLEHVTVLIHPDDRDQVWKIVSELYPRNGETRRVVARFRRFDGEYRALAVTVTNLLHDDSVRGIVANGRDVTEQLEFEATLRRQEEWFRSLVQHCCDAIAVIDANGRILYVSFAVRNLLGYHVEDLAQRRVGEILHPADIAIVNATFRSARSHPGFRGPIEVRALHLDGTWRWLEVVLTNRLDDPVVAGIVANFRDVTERREMEQRLAHQALHDPLTGLPNRTLLLDRLSHALTRTRRHGTAVGVCCSSISTASSTSTTPAATAPATRSSA